MPRILIHALIVAMLALYAMSSTTFSNAQSPAADVEATAVPAATLDKLVGPIALYPDDLIAIILPAATYPVEIVQADRFLDQRKSDKSLKVNESWHDPVKALLNYPEVVKRMSTDLDWTISVGEAVVADQGAVLEAVQRFRRQTQAAGQLKSDDKQVVVVEKEVIKIVPADPQVIYVPQYNPTTVVVAGAPPTYAYLPAPYPAYYYPYAPGAALATGLIWGAAISAAWNGGHYETHYGGGGNNNININRERNVERGDRERNVERGNINTGNINTGDVNRTRAQGGQSSAWRSEKKPGQVSGTTGRAAGAQRVGDAPGRGAAGGGNGFSGGGPQAAQRPATPATRDQGGQRSASAATREQGARASQGGGGDAFSGYGSARDAQANSSRGAASRQSYSDTRSRAPQASGHAGGGFSSGGGRGGGGGGFSRGGGGRGGGRR
ncbi:DUF3300 domain-containing protein [Paraburkholderia sp. FT54]|uniref:DUF3300 domain-containing protein n=1 Tax=Paraburkholderia sp. FT54 TaxID=3074437 RepID=UPI00287751BB|nr:DUF3300 domain-containing protein [Paraburkholderia sp. FT54]WNC94146.1 DUF3300 domain-containing protein [Paraburkholderia sp. FT54]